MLCQTVVRDHEFLQWRLDVVEIDVGDEAIDAGVDGRRSVAMHIALSRDQVRECGEIGEAAGHRSVSLETADALVIIALSVELLGRHQPVIGKARMLALERITELGPVAFVFPARIGHHPVEIVERARGEEIDRALRRRQRHIQRHAILFGDIGKDGLAVADPVMVVDDIGQLSARRLRRIENVFMPERHPGELQKSEYFQTVAIVVGDAVQRRIGIKREHGGPSLSRWLQTTFKIYQPETSARTARRHKRERLRHVGTTGKSARRSPLAIVNLIKSLSQLRLRKQTSGQIWITSVLCQQETHAPQQTATSSDGSVVAWAQLTSARVVPSRW